MVDILIRNLDEDDLARIDRRADRLGISRSEYIRRTLHQDARRGERPFTMEDLKRFAAAAADLQDEDIMRGAWS